MNAKEKKRLQSIISRLEDLRDELEELKNNERDKFENMPESLQQTERGENIETCADTMEEAYDSLDGLIYDLQEIV